MIQIKRHQRKEDYSLIRNQLSQEQTFALFRMVCFLLVTAAVFLIYIAMNNIL